MAANNNPRPVPPAVRIARIGSFTAIVSLAIIQFLVPSIWSGREIVRSVYQEYVARSFLAVAIVGFLVNLWGVQYRNGGIWLTCWALCVLLALMLQPAIATS